MVIFRILPVLLAALLLAAHFFRAGQGGLALVSAGAPMILLTGRLWAVRILQILLLVASLVWFQATLEFVGIRQALGLPWTRLALILGTVAAFTAGSALILEREKIKRYLATDITTSLPPVAAFILTMILLAIVRAKVTFPILLLDRFFHDWGWLEIFLLSFYAAVVTEKMLDPAQTARWRKRIWLIFSAVFFAQLILGIFGLEYFLMTGQLHLPVPAMIAAGPLFRGEGFFMPILFISTVVLIGPAWCSHLCYIGAWDTALAESKRRTPKVLPVWRSELRVAVLIIIIISALGLRLLGVSSIIATVLGLVFGLVGVGVMIFWSRRTGSMTHCTAYCPIGALAGWLGRISPFRMKIQAACNECGRCRLKCRYDALNMSDIQKRRPGISCTLCGDCIVSCPDRFIEYRFPGLKPQTARALFLVMTISLHAAALGLARI